MQATIEEKSITHEVVQDRVAPADWRVEAIDSKSGDVFVTIFCGPLAEERAREYAKFKQSIY